MARVVLGPGLGNVANAHFLDLTVHWYVGYCCSGACGKCLALLTPAYMSFTVYNACVGEVSV